MNTIELNIKLNINGTDHLFTRDELSWLYNDIGELLNYPPVNITHNPYYIEAPESLDLYEITCLD